jgi:hypothetical protein
MKRKVRMGRVVNHEEPPRATKQRAIPDSSDGRGLIGAIDDILGDQSFDPVWLQISHRKSGQSPSAPIFTAKFGTST